MGVSARVAGAIVGAAVAGAGGLATLPSSRPSDQHLTAHRTGEPAGEASPVRGVGTLAAVSVAAPLGLYIGAELVRSPAWGRALSGASMGVMAGLMGVMTLAMGDMDMGPRR